MVIIVNTRLSLILSTWRLPGRVGRNQHSDSRDQVGALSIFAIRACVPRVYRTAGDIVVSVGDNISGMGQHRTTRAFGRYVSSSTGDAYTSHSAVRGAQAAVARGQK